MGNDERHSTKIGSNNFMPLNQTAVYSSFKRKLVSKKCELFAAHHNRTWHLGIVSIFSPTLCKQVTQRWAYCYCQLCMWNHLRNIYLKDFFQRELTDFSHPKKIWKTCIACYIRVQFLKEPRHTEQTIHLLILNVPKNIFYSLHKQFPDKM